ncbi:MAG: hypothetical protein Q7T57_01145 [Dehalococcoidales bacterium]|nr:hypothetical protein [Dehalococcoidales bacterium]
MEKLVCDRCGFEVDKREDINLALDGTEAWQDACRSRGEEPRGVFPCKYYWQCKGQMLLAKDKKKGLFGRGK